MNILIIDDSKAVREKVKSVLKKARLFKKYFEAENGIEGFKILLDNDIDLIICDILMPKIDGFKFLNMAKDKLESDNIPLIMLTAIGNNEEKIKGLELGATDYVTKPFDEGELLARVKVQLKVKALQDRLKSTNKRLEDLSNIDELTGLYNRRRLMEVLSGEFEEGKRYSTNLSFIMLDIDDFKSINDIYGHQKGDMVLKEIGKLLKRNIRTTDIAGRYGGEEFAIILTQTDINGAKVSAERIRRNVEKHEFDGLERVTISLGVSSNKNCNSIDELIKRADEALYMGKKRGKNRVEIEGGGAPSI